MSEVPDPPAAAPEAAVPAPQPRMPAAARAVLYPPAWFLCTLSALSLAPISHMLYIAVTGGDWMSVAQQLGREELLVLGWPTAIAMQWCALAGTLAVTWFFARHVDRGPKAVPGFHPTRPQGLHWVLGVVLGGLVMATIYLGGRLAGWYDITGAQPAGRAVGLLLASVLFFLPAAAVEEISMRGYVQRVLAERYGAGWAIGVTSVVFALLHYWNPGFRSGPGAFLGLVLAGIYLGLAYHLTGRLYFPIALHAAWNLFEGPVFGFRVSGAVFPSVLRLQQQGPALWTGGEFGPEAGLVNPAALLLHLPLLVLAARWLLRQDEAAWGGAPTPVAGS